MSHFLMVDGEYDRDAATNSGWAAFRRWAWSLGPGPVRDFAETGETEEPSKLAAALDKAVAVDPEVESIRSELLQAAEASYRHLQITDGTE